MNIDIGSKIKTLRLSKSMTQEQLAYIIDRDPRTVMYHENWSCTIKVDKYNSKIK